MNIQGFSLPSQYAVSDRRVSKIGASSSVSETAADAKVEVNPKVNFILDKLVKHKYLSESQAETLAVKVKDPKNLWEAVADTVGPGDAANIAYKLARGTVLPNGVLAPDDDPAYAKKIAALSKRDVEILEEVTGRDLSLGQFDLMTVAFIEERAQGRIRGELQLSDVETIRNAFSEEARKDPEHGDYINEMLDKLYKVLERKEPKNQPTNRPLGL